MGRVQRPHILGIDDGPFAKGATSEVAIVGVVMEGPDLVEGVALTTFPVDGPAVTPFLADWVGGLRFRPALQGIVLGGITIAGLAVVDIELLSERLGTPVLVVNRRDPSNHRLDVGLRAAGFEERLAIVERSPAAFAVNNGLFLSHAGIDAAGAAALVRATLRKSSFPEPLRLAHLIARAIVSGESRGRP
jgi:endonuclease V-like protein UPF0215 family